MAVGVMPRRSALTVSGAAVALLGLLTACSGASSGTTGATTPGVSPRTHASSTSASPTPSPSVTGLSATCDSALPLSAIDDAAGQPIIGNTSFVVGVAEPDIGRLAYLNCRYGLADVVVGQPVPVPLVEIGVSLYDSTDQATTRATGTVEDYRTHGAAPTDVRLGTDTATVLTGYGATTLVAARGTRTVAVSVDPSVLTSNSVLVTLATLAFAKVT